MEVLRRDGGFKMVFEQSTEWGESKESALAYWGSEERCGKSGDPTFEGGEPTNEGGDGKGDEGKGEEGKGEEGKVQEAKEKGAGFERVILRKTSQGLPSISPCHFRP